MKKSRFASSIIVLALIGTTAFTFQAFGSRSIFLAGSFPDSGAANNLFLITQNTNSSAQSPSSGLPDPGSADLLTSVLNPGNCFSASYPAASDCDRLASAGAPQSATGINVHGLTLQSCFFGVYHASSDCDRLASMQGSTLVVRNRPTSLNCFSEVYHAGSDCDRLASGIR
jgi:hypothetical protein